MPKITVDLRFIDIGYERMMIEQYVALIDAHLADLKNRESKRLSDATDPDDPADTQLLMHLQDRLAEGVTTRFLAGSAVLAIWALYEAAVEELADFIQKKRGLSLRLSAIRGPFVERARKYFDDVLKFPLHSKTTDWERLQALERLRHALAHGNGDLRQVQPNRLKAFEAWCKASTGIAVVDERYVVIQPEFTKDGISFLKALLDDLIERTKSEF